MSATTSSDLSFGRYEILSELGRGSMGVVYRARDPKIDRIVAIKTISLVQEEEEAEFRDRFILEAQAAGRLTHPAIVTVYDVAEDPETHAPYIVMEYVSGQTLKQLLAPGRAKPPIDTALRLAQEVAEALAYAHARGVVHRDIKPANIMITEDEHAKIMDFGVAKLDLSQRTQSGILMGTPAYMSPEQLTGQAVDGRSDIFSLGVVLYTMLVGHRPFQGSGVGTIGFKVVHSEPLPITTISPELPPDIDRIVSRAIAKELDKRYQSGSEMAADLARLREQLQGVTAEAGVSSDATPGADPLGTAVIQKTQPYAMPAEGTARAGVEIKSPPWYRNKLYRIAAIALFVCTSLIALGWHRLKPPALGRRSSAAPFAAAVKPAVPSAPKAIASSVPSRADDDAATTRKRSAAANTSANLRIDVEYPFSSGKISLWIDGKLKYSDTLRGEAKKKLIVFRKTEGRTFEKIQIPAGKHTIRVRVQAPEQFYDLANTINANLADNTTQTLSVHCEKEEVKLSLE